LAILSAHRDGPMAESPIIRIEGLYHAYEEGVPALNGVDLEVADGALVALIGQNGSGKTTLAKHLNGLLRPTEGHVSVAGQDVATTPVARLARTVGYVFQNPDHQIFAATTREEIGFGLRNLGLAPGEVSARTAETLEIFGLTAYAEVPPAVLGFGLRRKVTVAAVFAMRPRILVLDEPTNGLDRRSTDELMARVTGLQREGHTVLLITHDMRLVADNAPWTVVLHEGRVLAQGPTRDVLARSGPMQTAHIAPPQITRLARRLPSGGMPPDVLTVGEFCAAYKRAVEARRGSAV